MRLSIWNTHSLNCSAWVKEEELAQLRETIVVKDHLCVFRFYFLLVLILSLRKLRGFLLYGFLEENSLCLWSLVIIVVHVILSYKILRSYWLNDKNLTILCVYVWMLNVFWTTCMNVHRINSCRFAYIWIIVYQSHCISWIYLYSTTSIDIINHSEHR